MNILVTGGCGYIGSHTIVDLIENDYTNLFCVDNLLNSDEKLLEGCKKITNRVISNINIDLCDYDKTHDFFEQNKIEAIIHFAALKSVPESVQNPYRYYHNNISSLNNLLKLTNDFGISKFIFSSSCSVYGNSIDLPVTEKTQLRDPLSPYGATKQMGEQIIKDFAQICPNTKFVLLRYFNPVGAHPSALIGEIPRGKPQTIIPSITQAAAGLLPCISVFGTDYNTRDGSCIRDFIHVCDIAHAHTLALQYADSKVMDTNYEVFNLGTGVGVSILEVIQTFEKVNNLKLNVLYANRREGDVISVYANNNKAKDKLNWFEKYSLNDMLSTAWEWQLKLKEL
jgi:UDP-glucose 4-epimerase